MTGPGEAVPAFTSEAGERAHRARACARLLPSRGRPAGLPGAGRSSVQAASRRCGRRRIAGPLNFRGVPRCDGMLGMAGIGKKLGQERMHPDSTPIGAMQQPSARRSKCVMILNACRPRGTRARG